MISQASPSSLFVIGRPHSHLELIIRILLSDIPHLQNDMMRVQMRCGPICRRGERHKSLGVKLVRATNNICLVEDISVDLVLSVGPSCDHDKRDPFNGSRVINTLGAISCYRQEPPINKYSHNPAPSTCSMCTSQSVTIFLFFSGIITLFSVSGEDLAGKRSNFLSDTK